MTNLAFQQLMNRYGARSAFEDTQGKFIIVEGSCRECGESQVRIVDGSKLKCVACHKPMVWPGRK